VDPASSSGAGCRSRRRLRLGNLKPALRVQAHVATFSQV